MNKGEKIKKDFFCRSRLDVTMIFFLGNAYTLQTSEIQEFLTPGFNIFRPAIVWIIRSYTRMICIPCDLLVVHPYTNIGKGKGQNSEWLKNSAQCSKNNEESMGGRTMEDWLWRSAGNIYPYYQTVDIMQKSSHIQGPCL